jgi:hypothetical protein
MIATQFRLVLMKFVGVMEPVFRALTCLESTNSTLGDVFAYWLALIAAMDFLFSSGSCELPKEAIQRLKRSINARFTNAVNEAPTDAFVAGHFMHPGTYTYLSPNDGGLC